jgi:ZU5 domain
MTVRSRTIAFATFSIAAFAACSVSDSTTVSPRSDRLAPASVAERSTAPAPKTRVKPLHRNAKLASVITVSGTIGASGGSLSIPEAGVTVTVPAGALLVPVKISMTALPGDVVAYDFAPHGLVFLKPISIAQRLAGTKEKGKRDRSPDSVELGYFALPGQLGTLISEVDELSGGSETGEVFTSSIWHFSGYMLGCGRGGK